MKQHITKEQWDELGVTKRGTLLNKVQPKWRNISERIEWITIGQMIEFLGENLITIKYSGMAWNIVRWGEDKRRKKWHKELVDILWEAVKEKLK